MIPLLIAIFTDTYNFDTEFSSKLAQYLDDKTSIEQYLEENSDKNNLTKIEVHKALNKFLQKEWLRTPSLERDQVAKTFDKNLQEIFELQQSKYKKEHEQMIQNLQDSTYFVIHGGSLASLKVRFQYFIKHFVNNNQDSIDTNQNLPTTHTEITIYTLSDERDLWYDNEVEKAFIDEYFKNDNEARNLLKEVKNLSRIEIPEEFKKKNVKWPTENDLMNHFIKSINQNYPYIRCIKIAVDKKNDKRPNTSDTIRELYKHFEHNEARLVFISSQPHVDYQHQVAMSLNSNDKLHITTIGQPINNSENLNLSVMMDAFARMVYTGYNALLDKSKNNTRSFRETVETNRQKLPQPNYRV